MSRYFKSTEEMSRLIALLFYDIQAGRQARGTLATAIYNFESFDLMCTTGTSTAILSKLSGVSTTFSLPLPAV